MAWMTYNANTIPIRAAFATELQEIGIAQCVAQYITTNT